MKFYNGINKVEKAVVAVLTLLLVFVVFLQVINRTIIKATIAWPEEAARYLMVWQVFLASVIAFRTGANCCIDVLINRFHGKIRIAMACFVNMVCCLFAVVLLSASIEVISSQIMFHQTSTAMNINMAFVYGALPTWSILFIVELVFMTIQIFRPSAFNQEGAEVNT